MQNLIDNLQIRVNEKLYLKDPKSSDVGKNILSKGVILIDKLGFEQFTFRKLATELKTSESTVYRYFESKQKLLLYITSWYWSWLEYQLVFATSNMPSASERLRVAIEVLSRDNSTIEQFDQIDLKTIHRIVILESSKAYLTKEVDEANKEGSYASYKRVVGRLAQNVLEINPKFAQPHSLMSTVVEGIHHQKFFADHLPSLTDIRNDWKDLADFFYQMALTTIKHSKISK